MRVHPTKGIIVTAPTRAKITDIQAFVSRYTPWGQQALAHVQKQKSAVPVPEGSGREWKARARQLLRDRTQHFAKRLGVSYTRIALKNTSTRWGSCSAKGNINLHYQLYFLPIEILDYVVVHELCHLLEMNHSRTFWTHVAHVLPDYVARRRALERYHPV